ncbi:MAG TPA: CPBP family intramembrane glutamic endopeptidase [Verrucomicrobiae bacterium]
MLWKKTWQPEAVLALAGGVVSVFVFSSVAGGLLHRAAVPGFQHDASIGNVLVATLSFHATVLAFGAVFLKWHDVHWAELLGLARWRRAVALALLALLVAAPVMLALKVTSGLVLEKLGVPIADQEAIELILAAKNPWLLAYLAFFAVIVAPLAEEFFFRGLLFSACKKFGWPKAGWAGVSLLFALIHFNLPTFLPLFAFALALTWLYETTEGLLAPMVAHALFNSANLLLLCLVKS